jgi:hypothetical protein
MIESEPAVATSAMRGMSSIASLPRLLPSTIPLESIRAATRCAGDSPSPMNRMTFFALRGPVSNTVQVMARLRVPSLTSTVTKPGFVSVTSRSNSADWSLPSSRSTNVAAWPNAAA